MESEEGLRGMCIYLWCFVLCNVNIFNILFVKLKINERVIIFKYNILKEKG